MEKWHNAYLELMFGNNHTEKTMNVAAEIKYKHMPEFLYKYRCFSDNHISALKDDCLFSSSADYLNDIREAPIKILTDKLRQRALQKAYDKAREDEPQLPEASINNAYDIAAQFHSLHAKRYGEMAFTYPEPGADEVIDTIIEFINNTSNELLEKELQSIRNMYNVCSFSATYNEDLMWSHYADSHKGFCIEYNFKSLGITDERVQLLLPIIYQETPTIEINDLSEADGSLAMYALTLKSRYWEYEHEWRSFYLHTEKPNPEAMPNPKAVYLGVKCSDENKQKMIEICEEKNISLYQMKLVSFNSILQPQQIL